MKKVLVFLFLALAGTPVLAQQTKSPKLVVGIVIDQTGRFDGLSRVVEWR